MHKTLRILLAASSLQTLAAGLFLPIYAIFVQHIGGDILTAGYAYSLFALVSGILLYAISRWEDSVRHQQVLVAAGYLITALCYLLYIYVSEPIHLFAVQALFGIGNAILTPAYDSVYTLSLERKKSASGWGAWEAMYLVVTGVAASLGAYVVFHWGFRTLFSVMALLTVGSFFTTLLIKE